MDDEYNLSDEDLQLWHFVSQGVEAMPGKQAIEPEETLSEESYQEAQVTNQELEKLVVESKKQVSKPQLDYIKHGTSSGVDKATARRLTGGKFQIENTLDLHGKTQEQALEELRYFIKNSFDSGKRCLLVITGKGANNDGILKNQVPRWLNIRGLREYVLMFSYAQNKHGGDGALYVLLKKRK